MNELITPILAIYFGLNAIMIGFWTTSYKMEGDYLTWKKWIPSALLCLFFGIPSLIYELVIDKINDRRMDENEQEHNEVNKNEPQT